MESAPSIEVDVVFATPSRQVVRRVRLAAGSSVEMAIRQSGLLAEFPEIDLARNPVGVFGEVVSRDTRLDGGERVEIYRPLPVDPKEARRRRGRTKRSSR